MVCLAMGQVRGLGSLWPEIFSGIHPQREGATESFFEAAGSVDRSGNRTRNSSLGWPPRYHYAISTVVNHELITVCYDISGQTE